jgi:hypothetical protein
MNKRKTSATGSERWMMKVVANGLADYGSDMKKLEAPNGGENGNARPKGKTARKILILTKVRRMKKRKLHVKISLDSRKRAWMMMRKVEKILTLIWMMKLRNLYLDCNTYFHLYLIR